MTHKAKNITDKKTKSSFLRYWSETLKRDVSACDTKLAPSHRTINKAASFAVLPLVCTTTYKSYLRSECGPFCARYSMPLQKRSKRVKVYKNSSLSQESAVDEHTLERGSTVDQFSSVEQWMQWCFTPAHRTTFQPQRVTFYIRMICVYR